MEGWLQENAVLPVLGALRLKSGPFPGRGHSLDSSRAGAASFTQAGASHPLCFCPVGSPPQAMGD